MYLFLDSSQFLQVGILDESLSWKHYELITNRKGSQILHSVIFSCLEEHSLKVKDLKGIILANGPGSYTGIRVAEGVAQVLELDGLPVFSFYHYEVPEFAGIKEYSFFSEAFKGEIFCYEYLNNGGESSLIKESEFLNIEFNQDNLFCLDGQIIDTDLDSIYDLLKKEPQAIFKRVLERAEHLPPYYYRPLDKEFTVGKR